MKKEAWIASGAVAALSVATMSSMGARAEDVQRLEAQRSALVQQATVLTEPTGSASWLSGAWNSLTNGLRAVSPIRWGFAAVTAANVATKEDEQAMIRNDVADDTWVRAVQASSDTLLAPGGK